MNTPTINIPPGWRRLRDEEVVRAGDKILFLPRVVHLDLSDIKVWEETVATLGNRPTLYGSSFAFIRHEPEPAPEEKLWLNPWE